MNSLLRLTSKFRPFSQPRRPRRLALLASLGLWLAGCAVGPDFKQPHPPQVSGYTSEPLPSRTASAQGPGGQPQHFLEGADLPGEWWTLFHSPALNTLIERALTNNPTLKAAQAALMAARENVLAQKGAFFPSLAGSFSAARQKTAADISPTPNSGALYFNLYTPQVNVSYAPDVFGLNRRTVESLQAQAEQTRFALLATHITLSANVAAAAIQEAALREQIEATRQLLASSTNMLAILRAQFAKGYASRLDLAAQEAQMAQVAATLPPLLKQLAQQRDALAALAGGWPSQELPERFALADLALPQDLPVSLPSQLVAQRPDVRQAEENLRSASAQIGIAVANRLPNLTLSADLGSTALTAGQIFAGGSGVWALAGGVTQPLFQGGALRHKERAARAGCVQAAVQYRSAVLGAFQNVADTLVALEQDARALAAAAAARDAAQVTLDLAAQQWKSGYANYLTLLNAQIAWQQAAINLVQAQANRYADTVALFQALGGGWWHRADLAHS